MKSVSKAALAAAVLLAVPFAASAPAVAQKKQKGEAPKYKLSDAFRKSATEIEALIKAKDFQGAAGKLDALEALATNDDEKFFVANFRLTTSANLKDNPTTLRALDALIANPKTDPANLGQYYFFRGDIAQGMKKSAEAIPFLLKARELGYAPNGANLNLLIAQAQFDAGQLEAAVGSIDAAIKVEEAAGRKAPLAWYRIAVDRLYRGGKKAAASEWLGRQMAAHPSAEGWRATLLVYMEQTREKGVPMDADLQLDVFRLMRAAKAMGGEFDYQEYADLAQRRGLPWEAKAVIEEGRAAGKIQATNVAINELYRSAVVREKAEGSLAAEEKTATAAANGTAAKNVGDAYLGSRNFTKAAELYRVALQKGGVDANLVNTRLGIALAMLGQKAEAKAAFGAVSATPRSEVARFWTTWIDQAPAA
jgi:tetratricopeptide (TPR) repeat protein